MALPPVVEIDNVPLPVSDNGTTLSVDDGGGSITVDGAVQTGNAKVTIHNAVTLTSTGSATISDELGALQEIVFTARVAGPVTGTSPTLQFTVQDKDFQGNLTGNSTTSPTFTAPTVVQVFRHFTRTGLIQLNHTVGGTTPSFGGVSVWCATRDSGQTVDGRGTAGSPAGGVVSVQGVLSGTPVRAQISDGTDNAGVAPASSAVVASDPALAVGLSPNTPLPAGTNTIGALVANQSVNVTQIAGATVLTGGVAGSQGVGGLAAHGAANAGNPLLLGVVDTPAGNIYRLLGDSSGRQIIVGAAADSAAVAGNPVLLGGSDGTNARTAQLRNTEVLPDGIFGIVVRAIPERNTTFSAIATGVALGNLKSMLAVFVPLANSNVLRLRRISIRNVQSTAVTGVVATLELRRISALSAGTAVTPNQMDTGDAALAAGTLCRTGGTFTDGALVDRWLWSSDEWGPGALDQEGSEHSLHNMLSAWEVGSITPEQPLTLRPGQGAHIKCATNTTAGTFDIVFVFTQD